jgi:hypothetical protein
VIQPKPLPVFLHRHLLVFGIKLRMIDTQIALLEMTTHYDALHQHGPQSPTCQLSAANEE